MIRCAKINVIIDPTLCATCEAKRLILYNLLEFLPLQLFLQNLNFLPNILSFRTAGVRQVDNVKAVVERASQIQHRPTLGPNSIIFYNFPIRGCCGTLLIRN